jgi:glycine cleavage system H protein
VESVKAVSELYSPAAGEVVEVNTPLADKPETINQDPHGAAWMIVLKLAAPAAPGLLDAAAYEALVASEAK